MSNFIVIPWSMYWLPLVITFVISCLLTYLIRKWALAKGIFAYITHHQIHQKPMVRLGGVAMVVAFVISFVWWIDLSPAYIGMLAALAVLFLMGLIDDLINLPPLVKLFGQFLSIGIAVGFGVHIGQLTNPFGGVIILPFWWDMILSGFWLWIIINAVNLLDGLDGLAGGVTSIGAITFFFLSLTIVVNQPETALISIILLGAVLGFLVWNWYPAKIFMGDNGSYSLGFLLGAISIISGAKLATAALVLGFPILDMIWASLRRISQGKNPFSADQGHLHHQLLKIGIHHRNVVILILSISAVFGLVSLISGTALKLVTLVISLLAMIILIRSIFLIQRSKSS